MQTVTYYYTRRKPKAVTFNYGKRNCWNIHFVFLKFLGGFWVRPYNYLSKLFIAFLGVTQFKDTLRTNLHLKLCLQYGSETHHSLTPLFPLGTSGPNRMTSGQWSRLVFRKRRFESTRLSGLTQFLQEQCVEITYDEFLPNPQHSSSIHSSYTMHLKQFLSNPRISLIRNDEKRLLSHMTAATG